MAVAAQKSVASLMRKTLDRQASMARMKLSLKKKQVEQILTSYVNDRKIGPYSELLKVLNGCPLNDDNFKILIEDCLCNVVILGRELKPFVEIVCSLNWINRGEELVDLYKRFLLALVTAHTYHAPRIMTGLIKIFKEEVKNWNEVPPDEMLTNWSHAHMAIAEIISLMPLTSDLLMQTIVDQFPYYKAGCSINRAYIHNLIWISKYIPSLAEQIMSAIVNRMVDMDTNIVEHEKNKQEAALIEQDEMQGVRETLDHCMWEMLKWLEDERDPILHITCNVFERVLLPTHGIKHVQFLLLYAISISQQCADRVFRNLWIVAAGLHSHGSSAITTRRTAASHLAGLLARCVRVSNSRMTNYLKEMADWCHAYVTASQDTVSQDNNKVHGAFYSICHSIFYLVAFKNHHLFMNRESINFVESLNLPRLVTCALNPLRTCPPQVTRAFSSVTRSHQVVYCQAIIEKNTRLSLQNEHKFDEWFPYDPYTLPISGKIIWPLCIEYKGWLKEGDDETQYTSLKRKLIEDDDYLIPSPSQKLATSLSSYTAPGFKTSESIMM